MGLEVTTTHLVWFVALLTVSSMLAGAGLNAHDAFNEGVEDRHDVESERMRTRTGPATRSYDPNTEVLTIRVPNTGKVPLDASAVTLVMDGIVQADATVTVSPAGATDVWKPREYIEFTLTGQGGAPQRVQIVTATGVISTTTWTPGEVTTVKVIPDPVDVPAGETQDFEARAYDANWIRILGVTFTWTTDAGTIEALTDDTARLTAQTTAEDGLSVTATEVDSGVSGSATVNVVANDLASITVSPNPVTVAPSSTQQFTAEGADQYGNPITLTDVTWSADVGTIDQNGLYTAPGTEGTATVTATQGGISGTADVTIQQYAYASASYTDVAGGTVTNADSWTRATGDVATLDETAPILTITRPEDQNDREFTNDPVSGWTLTEVSRTWSLTRDGTDGTPLTTGALRAEQTSNGNGEAYVEHTWTQGAQASPTDVTFTMDYKFNAGTHANRYLEVHLVKPDGSTYQIGTRKDATNGAWTQFGPATLPSAEVSAEGTYTLRVVVALRGSGEAALVDNVQLTWTTDGNHRFGKQLQVPDVPVGNGVTHALEIRYRLTDAEALQVRVRDVNGDWTTRATLTSTTMTTASIALTADDIVNGDLDLRLLDDNQSGDTQNADSWEVDFVRVYATT